jgi:hypothetical protein
MTRRLVAVTALLALIASTPHAQQGGANQPGTLWTEARLREAVDIARVGRKLTPKSWPRGG